MRVCYFGIYRSQYSRNQIMIEGLRRNGVAVIECHEPLWHDIDDRVQVASGGWFSIGFLLRLCRVLFRLLRAYLRIGSYDVMVLGYPGQLDVCLARLLTWIHRKPLVLDVFMSLYLIASERNIVDKSPISGYLLYKIERLAYRLPDLLIQDTSEYMNWFKKTFDISPQRFRLVPTGADDRVFYPRSKTSENEKNFLVIYHGTFIPNHGVEYIVEAANLLRNESGIHFELIGEGPSRKQAEQLVEAYGLQNVSLVGWVEKEELPRRLSQADLCLGVFGSTPQSLMTVQNKIYEALAMAKPLVTGDSPTVRSQLIQGQDLYLVPREDGAALAEAIRKLRSSPALCRHLSESGHQTFKQRYTPRKLGEAYQRWLSELT